MLEEDNVDIFQEDILDERAICQLRRIVETTSAEIVLSSSWRWYKDQRNTVHKQLKRKNIDFIDTTPIEITVKMSRTDEINAWLKKHPEIDNYVILDDEEIKDIKLIPHWVKTTFKHGLTRDKAEQAIKILKGELNE